MYLIKNPRIYLGFFLSLFTFLIIFNLFFNTYFYIKYIKIKNIESKNI